MRTAAWILASAVALAGARLLGPPPGPALGPRERAAGLLGPLRPIAAELIYLRAEERWAARDRLSYRQDVEQVLALRPDVPVLWAELAAHAMLDLPKEFRGDPAQERAWYAWGSDLVREGLARHPDAAILWLTLAHGLAAAEHSPQRLAGTPEADTWRELVVEACEQVRRCDDAVDVVRWQALEMEARFLREFLEEGRREYEPRVRALLELDEVRRVEELRRLLEESLAGSAQG